jgi:hypothetical protein
VKRLIAVAVSVVASAALAVGGTPAFAQANSERGAAAPSSYVSLRHAVSGGASYANPVKVNRAIVRQYATINSAKLYVAYVGQLLDMYCWVAPSGSADYYWFWVHPWGSNVWGFMRADLIKWVSYPNPVEHC